MKNISGQYQVGYIVDIIYNLENPDIVNIKPTVIFLLIGIIFPIVGVCLTNNKRSENKRMSKK